MRTEVLSDGSVRETYQDEEEIQELLEANLGERVRVVAFRQGFSIALDGELVAMALKTGEFALHGIILVGYCMFNASAVTRARITRGENNLTVYLAG